MKTREDTQKKFISLKEASRISGYAADYIGFLIRRKKIFGKRVYSGSKWLLLKNDLLDYLVKKKFSKPLKKSIFDFHRYITLKEASQISGYTPDHIGYLIRKGKLKGKQIFYGIKWLTTKEAIEDYLKLKKKKKTFSGILSFYFEKIFEKIIVLFFKTTKYVTISSIFGFIIFSALIVWAFVSLNSPQTIKIFPKNVSGDWEKIENAIGPADVSEKGEITHFSEKNSAVYSKGGKILIVENFNQTIFELLNTGLEKEENWLEKATSTQEATSSEENSIETQESTSLFEKFKNYLQKNIAKAQGNLSFEELKKKELISVKIKFSFALGEKPVDFYFKEKEAETKENEGSWLKNLRFSFFKNIVLAQENELETESANELSTKGIVDENAKKDIENLTPTSTTEGIENLISTSTEMGTEESINETETTSTEEIIQNLTSTLSEETTEEISTSTMPETIAPDSDLKIIIWYSLDGENWEVLREFSEDEVSNAKNGGYFAFEAPFLKSWEDLEKLKIKFEGVVGGQTNFVAFLDSVWLEVEYKEKEKTEYEIEALKKDWQAKENPTFIIKQKFEKEKKDIPEKLLGTVTSILEKKPKVKVHLRNLTEGKEIELKENEDFISETHSPTKVQILKPKDFKPGSFKVKIDFEKDGEIFVFEEEFSWGLAAINFNKSIYTDHDESAFIQIAVLDNNGHTICDAQLEMRILEPDGKETFFSTSDGTIKYSGQCGPNNVVDTPDYYAFYDLKEKPLGTYNVELIAKTNDGERKITDSFEVRELVPFDIERIGPTRIWPKAKYEMKIKIKANQDFEGEIVEKVPASFEIIQNTKYELQTPKYEIRDTNPETKEIIWKTSLKKDEEIELTYQFDAPDISPYLYLLGPLGLKNKKGIFDSQFEEARQWQIASDQTGANLILLWDGDTIPEGWTCISCNAGDPYYNIYPRGAPTYGATGGTSTHSHTVSYVSCTQSSGNRYDGRTQVNYYPHQTHIHDSIAQQNVSSASNEPLYRTLKFIKYSNGTPSTLPSGIIAIFATTTLPTNWSLYDSQNGYFLKGGSTVGTGGSNTHTHSVSITTGPPNATVMGASGGSSSESPTHSHNGSQLSASADHQPPYIEVIFAKAQATTSIPEGMIGMFDGELSENWSLVSGSGQQFYQRFLKGNSSGFGFTGGDTTHTHSNLNIPLSATPNTLSNARTAPSQVGAIFGHTHTMTVSFSTENHLPPYRDTIFAQYQPPALSQISGRIFTDEGQTTSTAGWTVSLVINGTRIASTTASTTDGSFSFSTTLAVNDVVLVYLDDSQGKGVSITKSTGSDISGLDIYQNRIIVRQEGGTPINISDLDTFDAEQDSDILYTASSSAGTLSTFSNSEFFIWPGATFNGWGEGIGNLSFSDLDIRGTFNATSSQQISVSCSGNFPDASCWQNLGTFGFDYSTVIFTSTSTGKTIIPGSSGFYNVEFNGEGGSWQFSTSTNINGNLRMTQGTLFGNSDITVYGGTIDCRVSSCGEINLSGGTVNIRGSGNFGTSGLVANWNFYNLTLGDGTNIATTTSYFGANSTLTISNDFQILSNHKFVAPNSGVTFEIKGNYTNSGDFIHNNGTLTFNSASSGKTITTGGSAFYNLVFTGGGSWNFQDSATTSNDLQVLSGTLNGNYNMSVFGGDVTGDGILNWTGGEFLVAGTGNFGGNSDWNFYNLTFGTGSSSGTTNKIGNGNITVSNVLKVSPNHTLNGGNQIWKLEGGGSPFLLQGTFNAASSTLIYNGPKTISTTTVALRPIANGSVNQWSVYPAGTEQWDAVNDEIPDGDTTYIYSSTADQNSLFNLPDNQIPEGSKINRVTVFAVARGTGVPARYFRIGVRTYDQNYWSPNISVSTNYTEYSQTWTTNPATGQSWTPQEINNLEVGVYQVTDGRQINVTQIYVIVEHIPPVYVSAATYWNLKLEPPENVYYVLGTQNNQTINVNNNFDAGGTNTTKIFANIYNLNLQVLKNFTISTTTQFFAPNAGYNFTVGGNFTNYGIFSHSNSTLVLNGNSQQTISGNLTGNSALYNLTITNSYGSVSGCDISFTPGIVFATSTEVLNNYTINTQILSGGVYVQYNSGSTYTFKNIYWTGTQTKQIYFRNSNLTSGYWYLVVDPTGIQQISYVNVGRSDASGGTQIIANNGTNTDCGNNINWLFLQLITISGYVFQDRGITTSTAGSIVHLAINGNSVATTTASTSTGEYIFNILPDYLATSTPITVFIDDLTTGESGAVITRYQGSGNISDLNIYNFYVILRHEDSGPITNQDIGHYDGDDNPNIPYSVTPGPIYNLTVNDNHTLLVLSSYTFEPTWNISTPLLIVENGATLNALNSTISLRSSGNPLQIEGGGIFSVGNSTISFEATSSTTTIPALTYYNLQTNPDTGTPAFVFATGTITVNNNFLATTTNNAQATINADINDPQITINNNFVLSQNQTFQASDSSRLKIAGNFENRGNFVHNSGTVEFINSSKETQILGSTTFYNFYSTTSNKTIKFEPGNQSTTTIEGIFYIAGGDCNNTIKLRSLNSPNQWYIQAASSSLEFIDIQDSYAINPLTAYNSYNSGNNTNWTILIGICLPPGINISGKVYIDEGNTLATSSLTVTLAIDGNFVATTTLIGGEYLFTINYGDPLAPTTSDPITIFISGGDSGAAITIYGTTEDILDLDIYLKRVIVRHHYGSFINNQKIGHYTNGTPYTVSAGPYYQLEVGSGHKILVWQGNTFKPEGNVLTPAIAIKGTFQPESNYLVLKDYGQDPDCSKGAGTVMPLCVFATGTIQTTFSTISFEATSSTTTIPALTYYNLQTNPETGTPAFVFAPGTITINNNFLATTTNDAQPTINANLNDPQITINNNFVLSQNQTFEASNSSALKIAGNFENRGNFVHNSGTVEFINSSKETQILGSTIFYNFYSTTSNKTIKFESGANSTTTIAGIFYINGGACNTTIKLLSSNSPQQWLIQAASSSINFASIKDSYAINSITANNSYDLGNNVNWTILTGSCTPPTEISGRVFIDEGNTTTTASLTVYLAINGSLRGTTQLSNGKYSFVFPYGDPSAPTTSDPITVFLDSQNATVSTVTIYGSGSITDLDIYYNRVILRHHYGSSINNSQIGHFSSTTLPFSVESGELIVKSGNKILVWQGNTFQPQGNVRTPAISIKGTFKPEGNTISLTAGGENTNCSLEAGTVMPLCLATGGSFDSGTSTVSFEGQATTAIATLYYYNLKTNASSTVTYYFRPGIFIISNDLILKNNGGQVTLRADLQNPSLTIGGNLTIEQNQTFVASASGSFYVAKSFSNQGTFTHNQGTIIFNGNQTGQTVNPGQNSFYNIRFNGSGSWEFLATTTVEGSFEILQGTVTAPSSTLEIAKNFRNDGTFNHNYGKVVFYSSSTESQILGPATFYDFSCETPSKILKFEPGSQNQITILNSLYLKPSPSDCETPIYLRSITDGQRWYIDAQGTTTLDYLYVKDSYAVTSLVAQNSIDARNNVNWTFFAGECAVAIEISGYVFKQDRITTSTEQSIVRLAIDGQYITSTVASLTGFYQFLNIPIILIPGVPVTVWLDDDLESGATIIRYQGEGNILGLDLYDKTITLRHGDPGPIDNFDIGHYQTFTIPFDVTEEGELSVNSGHRIFVYQNTNYTPRADIKTPAIVLAGNLNLENYNLSLFGTGESSNCNDNVATTMPLCVISGGNLNYASSTVSFEATEGTSTIAAISYYNLQTNPATGTPVFVFQSGNITIYNNFLSTTTDSAQAKISANLKDPQITINGNFINSQNQTFEASNSSKLKVAGNWKNEGNFVHNFGTVAFISDQEGREIDNGESAFGNLDFDGQGSWYFTTSTILDGGLRMVQGELYGTSTITIKGGNLDCGLTCGEINLTGGTVYLEGTGNLGTSGLKAYWYFNNFVLGDGENLATTTSRFAQNSGFNIFGNFEIRNYHNFIAPQAYVEFFVAGNYTNYGRFLHNNGELIIGGSSQQTLSGNLNGNSAFYTLSLENTSGTGDPFEPGIIFATSCKANLLKINGFGTKVQFEANALFEFNYINWKGASSTDMIYFRSSQEGTWWWLGVEHPTPVSFVNVQDSNATYTYPYIDATDGTNYDAGNNVNWIFEAIKISGKVFIDEGQTTTSQPLIVRLVINKDYYNATTVVSTTTGIYEFKNVPKNLATSTPMTVYVESATSGATITRHNGLGQDVNDLDIYLQRVIVRHHDSGPITNQDIGHYDIGTPYSVSLGPPFSLTVNSGYKLLVWQGSNFRPEGPVKTPALTIYGTFEPENYFLALTASGQNQDCSQVAGIVIPLCVGSNGQFIVASSTVSFEGTATSSVLAMTYYNLQFEPPTGGYFEFLGNATTTNNFSILAGTVSAPSILTVGGNWQNQGVFLHNFGEVILNSPSSVTLTAGGENGKFWNLTLANSSGTWILGSDLVVENVLNLQSGTLNGSTFKISLRGSQNPFVVSGNFESASSTVSFEGTGVTTSIPLLVYWNLQVNPATGTPEFTPESGNLVINNNLSVLRGVFNLAGQTHILGDILVGNDGKLNLNNQDLIVEGGSIETQGSGQISCSGCSNNTVYLSGTGQIGGGTGQIVFYNFTATGTGVTTLASEISLLNDLEIKENRTLDVSPGNYQITIGGSWKNSGVFIRRQGTVLFNSPTAGKIISDGGWPFWNIVFNSEGGSWLYKDSATSTPPNLTQVLAGEATFLNAKTGTIMVTGGQLNVDWYLGIHVVDKNTPTKNIDNASTTILEVTGSSTVWKMSGEDWGEPSSSQTTLTGSDGKTPQPNSDGAIRIREYTKTATQTFYYKYNLSIPPVPGFHGYDWYEDGYGGYITSVFNPEEGLEKVIGDNWHRIIISQMNTPYSGINQPPTNGSWYVGMTSDFEFSIDSISVNLGNLNELNIWTATGTTLLSATTSYPEGYTIKSYAIYDGELRYYEGENLIDTISRWPYLNSTPEYWPGNCDQNNQCGFGYTTSALLGPNCDDNRFASSTKYAGFATSSEATDEVAKSCQAVYGHQTTITYKVSAPRMKVPGTYEGTIYYIGFVNY